MWVNFKGKTTTTKESTDSTQFNMIPFNFVQFMVLIQRIVSFHPIPIISDNFLSGPQMCQRGPPFLSNCNAHQLHIVICLMGWLTFLSSCNLFKLGFNLHWSSNEFGWDNELWNFLSSSIYNVFLLANSECTGQLWVLLTNKKLNKLNWDALK